MRTLLTPLLAAALLLGNAAWAQDRGTESPPQNQQLRPQAPDSSSGSSTPQSGSSLSNELNRSGGVLQPPPTSDRGVMRPPSAGTQDMPVIPPPGSPGGNQQVQPK